MKKSFFLLCLLSLISLNINAQSKTLKVGVSAGYDYNMYSITPNYAYDYHYQSAGGLVVSVPVQWTFTDWLGIRADVQYAQKNWVLSRSNYLNGIRFKTTHTNHYLQLPVMAHFSFGGQRVRGYLNVGGFIGAWLAGKRHGTTGQALFIGQPEDAPFDFNETYEFNSARDQRFDAGLAGTIGIDVKINSFISLFAETGCQYSLVSTTKTKNMIYTNPSYNTTLTFQVGVLFSTNFNKNK